MIAIDINKHFTEKTLKQAFQFQFSKLFGQGFLFIYLLKCCDEFTLNSQIILAKSAFLANTSSPEYFLVTSCLLNRIAEYA